MSIVKKIVNSKLVERLKRQAVLKTGIYLRLKRINPTVSEELRIALLLNHYGFSKVLDVGANTGQFAESLRDFGYKGIIVSFEPVESVHQKLSKRAAKYKDWQVAERMAIGDKDGEVIINVSQSTDFSSIKQLKSEVSKRKTAAQVDKKEKVSIHRLDTLKGKYYTEDETIFLKVDTQGFEKEVLEGGEELLKIVKGVMLEMPLDQQLEIYEGVEWSFDDYFLFFKERGFDLLSVEPVVANKEIGALSEVNGIFVKK